MTLRQEGGSPYPALPQWRRQIAFLEFWDRLGVLAPKGRETLAYLRREVAEATKERDDG